MSFHAQRRRPPDRRHGRLLFYRGSRAHVLFGESSASMPAAPFQQMGLGPGESFVLIGERLPDGQLRRARIERTAAPHAPVSRRTTPPVYVRDGRRLTSRRRQLVTEVGLAIAELSATLDRRDGNIVAVLDEWEGPAPSIAVLALDPERVTAPDTCRGFKVHVRLGAPIIAQ